VPSSGQYFARAGRDVVFSYSRSRKKLEKLVKDAGARAQAGSPADAIQDANAALLAVHWTAMRLHRLWCPFREVQQDSFQSYLTIG
jgi:predicted dinucleotide-binding enzyme